MVASAQNDGSYQRDVLGRLQVQYNRVCLHVRQAQQVDTTTSVLAEYAYTHTHTHTYTHTRTQSCNAGKLQDVMQPCL